MNKFFITILSLFSLSAFAYEPQGLLDRESTTSEAKAGFDKDREHRPFEKGIKGGPEVRQEERQENRDIDPELDPIDDEYRPKEGIYDD